ncbi:MAG: ABC transporter ATP-binding protein [Syntrophaceae bacterium]|nr:ABC transporter ATP-binding protein [Syntrophaceae bacterium]
MLEIHNLSVFYGEFQALFEVSLRMAEGETVITVGPNGAGKSTLLKTISGLLQPRSGTITFLGKRIDRIPAHEIVELGISHVPEGGRLFPQLSVYENLKVGSFLPKARGEAAATLKDIYTLFPILDERKKQYADTLSGGERQMLAIARSLMSRPKLILLDEPSSGLAPRVVTRVLEFVHRIKSQGYSILMVEQNVRKALRLSDRAYLIESGRIVKEGPRKNFLEDDYIRKAYIGL